jgi:hypothetical protein
MSGEAPESPRKTGDESPASAVPERLAVLPKAVAQKGSHLSKFRAIRGLPESGVRQSSLESMLSSIKSDITELDLMGIVRSGNLDQFISKSGNSAATDLPAVADHRRGIRRHESLSSIPQRASRASSVQVLTNPHPSLVNKLTVSCAPFLVRCFIQFTPGGGGGGGGGGGNSSSTNNILGIEDNTGSAMPAESTRPRPIQASRLHTSDSLTSAIVEAPGPSQDFDAVADAVAPIIAVSACKLPLAVGDTAMVVRESPDGTVWFGFIVEAIGNVPESYVEPFDVDELRQPESPASARAATTAGTDEPEDGCGEPQPMTATSHFSNGSSVNNMSRSVLLEAPKVVRAVYPFADLDENVLTIFEGELLVLLDEGGDGDGWRLAGRIGKSGTFPAHYAVRCNVDGTSVGGGNE